MRHAVRAPRRLHLRTHSGGHGRDRHRHLAGAIPQNDLPAIQERTGGELAIIGGIDAPAVDIEHIGEEEIRAEVRRAIDAYCPAGRFCPSIPSGKCFRAWNDAVVNDELEKYGRRWAREHPILEAGQRPS